MIDVLLADPDETLPVKIDSRDRRAFERDGRKAIGGDGQPLDVLVHGMPESYMCWLSWHALRRAGTITLTFDQFAERFLGTDGTLDDESAGGLPDPTAPAPLAG